MSDGQVRIVSDGTVAGTTVYVDDVRLLTVKSITWMLDANDGQAAEAVIVVHRPAVELMGDALLGYAS